MTLTIDILALGPVGTNCYIVRADATAAEAVVVDPGAEVGRILSELDRLDARCVAILVTHTHYDHIGAVADLVALGARVVLPRGDDRDWNVLADPEGNEFCVFAPPDS